MSGCCLILTILNLSMMCMGMLPGAFIIYRADHETDEILFANREMILLPDAGRWMICLLIRTEASEILF